MLNEIKEQRPQGKLAQECGIAIRLWAKTTFQEMPIFLCLGKGREFKASKSQNVLVFG